MIQNNKRGRISTRKLEEEAFNNNLVIETGRQGHKRRF